MMCGTLLCSARRDRRQRHILSQTRGARSAGEDEGGERRVGERRGREGGRGGVGRGEEEDEGEERTREGKGRGGEAVVHTLHKSLSIFS